MDRISLRVFLYKLKKIFFFIVIFYSFILILVYFVYYDN